MSIQKRWSYFAKDNVRMVSNVFGVYELGDGSGDVHYIGEGKMRERLLSHFSTGSDPIPGTSYYRFETTGSKDRAVSRQNALLREYKNKYGRLPKYNQKSRR